MVTATNLVMVLGMLLGLRAGAAPFTYEHGLCRDDRGEVGLNKGRLGDCADLSYRPGVHQERFEFPRGLAKKSLRGAHLQHARLGRANLSGAQIENARMDEAILVSANLDSAHAANVDMVGADLRGASARAADLNHANLAGARLRGAVLTDANLRGAVLVGADLTFSDLRRASLRGADLRGAVTLAARFEGSSFDQRTRLPFDRARARALGMILSPE